jgi:hypothetical protein
MNSGVFRFVFYILILFGLISCGGDDAISISPPPVELSVVIVEQNTPTDQASDVEIDSSIVLDLSQVYNLDDIIFELTEVEPERRVEGLLSNNNQNIYFHSSTPLSYSKEYRVNISSKEGAQQKIENHSFSFKTVDPQQRLNSSFHPPIRKYGKTSFSIVPIESVEAEGPIKISFGVPFPKDYLNDIDKFRLLDEDENEVAIAVSKILPWRYPNDNLNSIRSVLVQLELEFQTNEYGLLSPRYFTLEWGVDRTVSELPIEPARSTWVLVDDAEFPATDKIYEPLAYALFQPSWYGDSVIKTRLLPLDSHSDFSAYDTAFKLFGDTAINYVDPRVIDDNLIPHRKSYAAWLFDRAMTIYQLAFRTGEFKYLRAAHRASQFYLQHINEQGYFSLKGSNDMKYSYGESLVADYILFGDERIPDKVESMIPAWDSFNSDYKLSTNFWTERHAAFQLKGYVTAYELTGKIEYKEKSHNTFINLKKMQDTPEDGVPKTGALMHTSASHGEGGVHFIASPWMSVLLIDAVERYYIQFENNEVNDFIIKMADYFQQENIALYEWKGYQGKDSFFVPYYLAGTNLTDREHGGIGANDLEHGVDVIKVFSSAYFYSCAIGECNQSYLKTISQLYNTAFTQNIPYWIRAAAPSSAFSSYRLAPPRKFNWWFNTTANNDFLLGKDTFFPIYKETAPLLTLTQKVIEFDYFKAGDEITFNFQLKNEGNSTAKNIVIKAFTPIKSPEGLLEVSTINQSGVNKAGEIVWYIEKLAPNEELSYFSFTVLVKDLPTLQRRTRPLGDILSFADVSYCDQADSIIDCPKWVNVWESGEQTYQVQSEWLSIPPIPPITPPAIGIIYPFNFEIVSGENNISAIIDDSDGIAKVDFLLDGEIIQTFNSPPYQTKIQFDALSANTHEITVKAWDTIGSGAVKSIYVEANNPDVVAPEINIISPEPENEYCNSVTVEYEVDDQFSISTCEAMLKGKSISLPNCASFELSNVIPLFSAKAYLPLNDKADIIASTNKTTLLGTLFGTTWNTELNRTSLNFSGAEDYVNFTTANLDISNDITVSFWLNPQSDEGVIMSQDWGYIGNEYGWAISLGPNNHVDNNSLAITWSSGTNTSNLNGGNVIQAPAYSVSLGKWQHVVVRKQDKQVDIFINGTLVISDQLVDGSIAWPINSQKKFTLAKAMNHPDMYNKNYQGLLDDIAVWNNVLTDDEIADIHQGVQGEEMQHLKVIAEDNAGNSGTSSVSFSFRSTCDTKQP